VSDVARCEIVLSTLGPAVLVWWDGQLMAAETHDTVDEALNRAAIFRAAIAGRAGAASRSARQLARRAAYGQPREKSAAG
jgi:hypothetical protein